MSNTRLKVIEKAFESQYGTAPELVVRAPGRVNLIGEHTDYNEGFVFPVAIDREMLVAASTNGTEKIIAYSLDYAQMDSFDINNITFNQSKPWSNYLRGVISTLKALNLPVLGFSAVLSGDVPQGAGLSSSAAFEVAIASVCNHFDNLNLSGKEIALLAQKSENEFIGVQCGIMDQFISALGQEDSALLIDCKSLDYRIVPLNLTKKEYSIVVTNSGVRRGLVESEYNARRLECNEGLQKLNEFSGKNMKSLRDASFEDICTNVGALSDKVLRRCRHVVSENQRVMAAVAALEAGDLNLLGQLMNASHESLRDDYQVSCPQIDKLVDLSQRHPGVLGSRITGGGFGGCTVTIMANRSIDTYISEVIPRYDSETDCKAEVYICVASQGASKLTARPRT